MPTIPIFTVKSGYQPQAIDTSLEVDMLMFELLRQLTPQQTGEWIDQTYLNQWAINLQLTDLLNTALLQSGQEK